MDTSLAPLCWDTHATTRPPMDACYLLHHIRASIPTSKDSPPTSQQVLLTPPHQGTPSSIGVTLLHWDLLPPFSIPSRRTPSSIQYLHTHTHKHSQTHTHTHTHAHTHTHTHTHTEIPMLLRISGSGEDDCQVCYTYDQMQKPMEVTCNMFGSGTAPDPKTYIK